MTTHPNDGFTVVAVGHTEEADLPYAYRLVVTADGFVADAGSGWAALIAARLAGIPGGERTRELVLDTINAIAERRRELVTVVR